MKTSISHFFIDRPAMYGMQTITTNRYGTIPAEGVGRLIRSKTDSGIVVVLDRRIVAKNYGRRFLDSIPPCPIEYF